MKPGADVAMIVGAETPFGKAAARALGEQGVRLALLQSGRTQEEQEWREDGTSLRLSGQLSDEPSVRALVARTVDVFDRVDILVNAWDPPQLELLEEVSEEEWIVSVESRLRSIFLFTKYASDEMAKAGGGRIVNMTVRELLGKGGGIPVATLASAIVSLTRTAAIELGRHQVSVNAVAVGEIDWFADSTQVPGALSRATPLRRKGSVSELSHTIAYLASRSSAYMTGQVLYLAGGQQLVPALNLD